MNNVAAAALALGLAIPIPAAAQDGDWTFRASLYGWFAGLDVSIDTPRGTVETELSFKDVLSDLDLAFMGSVEANYRRWSFIGDYVYTDLTSSEATPFGRAFSEVQVETTTSIFSGYALYRAVQSPDALLDIGAGFRWVDLDAVTTLRPGTLPGQSFDNGDSWADPLVAARLTVPFGDRWYGTALADIGGYWTQDSSTWQALGLVGYRFNRTWSAQFGYRYMSIENEIDGADVSLDLSGPLLGVSARF